MVGDCELEHLSDKECLELLRASSIGRIAFVVDDFPVAEQDRGLFLARVSDPQQFHEVLRRADDYNNRAPGG